MWIFDSHNPNDLVDWLWVVAVYAFVVLPIVVVVALSVWLVRRPLVRRRETNHGTRGETGRSPRRPANDAVEGRRRNGAAARGGNDAAGRPRRANGRDVSDA